MSKRDGGPAFPGEQFQEYPGGGGRTTWFPGMTLRDYFAAKAIAVMFDGKTNLDHLSAAKYAQKAYLVADAMLSQREGRQCGRQQEGRT